MADVKPDKAARLRALRQKFNKTLAARIEGFEAAWKAARQQGLESANLTDLTRGVHSLAGSAGTFNFHHLGKRANVLETMLQQFGRSSDQQTLSGDIEELMAQLSALADEGPDRLDESMPIESQAPGKKKMPLVYLLEDDEALAAEVAGQLQHFGYRIEVFRETAGFKAAMSLHPPDAQLINIELSEGCNAGPEIASELRGNSDQNMPIIFLSCHDTWQDRLNSVRAGGQAYLTKPLNIGLLAEQLDVFTSKPVTEYRILIVEDTQLLAEHYAAVLEAAGMIVRIVGDPSRLLEVIEEFAPELILMDIYLPGCNGVEAARVIRQYTGYNNVPIVYLSTENRIQQQLHALRAGGDDFLQKPITDSHLLEAVRIRAGRFYQISELMIRDSLTGLLNHINLKLALEREISQAKRRGSSLCFAMLDIDHFKSVNDQYGHPVGDRVIKNLAHLLSQRLRKGDMAGRYGGEEFALVLPDTSPEQARPLLDNLRETFADIVFHHDEGEFSCTFSAGIAACPPHEDMQSVIVAADATLYQAKHGGRNRVVSEIEAAPREVNDQQ